MSGIGWGKKIELALAEGDGETGTGSFLFFFSKKKMQKNAKDRQGPTKPPRTKYATE